MKRKILMTALSAMLILSATGVQAQAPMKQKQNPNAHQGIDPALLLKAKRVNSLNEKNIPLIVDVRSRYAYHAEHIKNAISYPYSTIKISKKFPFPKNKMLVMYCGCPHHLSGLSAEVLKSQGYKNVYVIDEGYWGWKQLGLPIFVNKNVPKRKKVSMDVEGQLKLANLQPVAYEDIFLLHPKTGQLEATRTDAAGNFRMTLHFQGVDDEDPIEFKFRDQVVQRMPFETLAAKKDHKVNLQVPLQTAMSHSE